VTAPAHTWKRVVKRHVVVVAVAAAPVKQVGKAVPTASKSASQSSVFVFKASQAAPTANGQTTARPAGLHL